MKGTNITSPNNTRIHNIHTCVDWRFLVNVPVNSKILIINGPDPNFMLPLEQINQPKMVVSLNLSSRNNLSPIGHQANDHRATIQAKIANLPISENILDLIIYPNSIPGKNEINDLNYYLKFGGALVFGFPSPFYNRRNKRKSLQRLSLLSVISLLGKIRSVSSFSCEVYGAFPDHLIPEIIFPLNTQSINFALTRIFNQTKTSILLSIGRFLAGFPLFPTLMPAYILILEKRE